MESQRYLYEDIEKEIFGNHTHYDVENWAGSLTYDGEMTKIDTARSKETMCCANIRMSDNPFITRRCERRVWAMSTLDLQARRKYEILTEKPATVDRLEKYCSFHFKKYIAMNTQYKAVCRVEDDLKKMEKTAQNLNLLADVKLKCARYRKAFSRAFYQKTGECSIDDNHLKVIYFLEREARDLKEQASQLLQATPTKKTRINKRPLSPGEISIRNALENIEVMQKDARNKVSKTVDYKKERIQAIKDKQKKKKKGKKGGKQEVEEEDVFESQDAYNGFYKKTFDVTKRPFLFDDIPGFLEMAFYFEVSYDEDAPHYQEHRKIKTKFPDAEKIYEKECEDGDNNKEYIEVFLYFFSLYKMEDIFQIYTSSNSQYIAFFKKLDAMVAERTKRSIQDVEKVFSNVAYSIKDTVAAFEKGMTRWYSFGNIRLTLEYIDLHADEDPILAEYRTAFSYYPLSVFKAMASFLSAYYTFYLDLNDVYVRIEELGEPGGVFRRIDAGIEEKRDVYTNASDMQTFYNLARDILNLRTSSQVSDALQPLIKVYNRTPMEWRNESWKLNHKILIMWSELLAFWSIQGKKLEGDIGIRFTEDGLTYPPKFTGFRTMIWNDDWLMDLGLSHISQYYDALKMNYNSTRRLIDSVSFYDEEEPRILKSLNERLVTEPTLQPSVLMSLIDQERDRLTLYLEAKTTRMTVD